MSPDGRRTDRRTDRQTNILFLRLTTQWALRAKILHLRQTKTKKSLRTDLIGGRSEILRKNIAGVPQEVHFLATAWIMSSWTSNGGIPPTTPVRRSGTRWLQNYNYDLYGLRMPPAHGYPHVDTRNFSIPEPRFGSTMSCGSLWLSGMSVSSVIFTDFK